MPSPNDGQPTPRPTESKLACLVCRQRKVACDRQRPQCGLCAKNDFECLYKASQRRPGLRAGYVSQLEKQLEDVRDRLRKVENHLEKGQTGFYPRHATTRSEDVDGDLNGDRNSNGNRNGDGDDLSVPTDEDGVYLVPSHTDTMTGDGASGSHEGVTDMSAPASILTPIAEPLLSSSGAMMGWQNLPSLCNPLTQETLPDFIVSRSLRTWFAKYHTWFPILHQASLQEAPVDPDSRYALVCQAITSVIVLDFQDAPAWERALAEQTRDRVMLQSSTASSLGAIQALLILSNHFYVKGSLTQFWSLVATCKRMLLHPRLQVYFNDFPCAFVARLPLARRAGPTPISDIEREEAIRVLWMTEMLDSISTLGLGNHAASLTTAMTTRLPCFESTWSSRVIPRDPTSPATPQYSSGYCLCIMFAVEELVTVRQFLEKPYDLSDLQQRLDWQTEAQRIDERLTNWREEFVAAVFQLINWEKDQIVRGEMEPFITLTNCILNTAVITLLQQMAPIPQEIDRDFEPWAFATNRCVYACENLTAKVRRIRVDELPDESPYLIMPVFVAARFYLAYSKALDADVPANAHTLSFTLHIFGKSWSMAEKFEYIIRTAAAEHRTPVSQCVLPIEFYDFRYSTAEIVDLLLAAAENLQMQQTAS